MTDASPRELELTPDLLEYARAVALKEAQKRCPDYVDFDDVVQEAILHLISKPPQYDPARGAAPKTLIHTIVQLAVLKYVARECRHAGRFGQLEEPHTEEEESALQRRPADLTTKCSSTDDVLEFIENEDSRALCRLVIECEGNVSEAARRLGVAEGTVRYRLRLLAPRLIAAGFDPFNKEEFQ